MTTQSFCLNNFLFPVLIFISAIILSSCEQTYVPKPKGYFRIDLPPHEYIKLNEGHPYRFELSKHAQVKKHISSIAEEHWIDVFYPEYRATVQLTYKPLHEKKIPADKKKFLNELVNDSYKLTSKHQVKAYAIEETIIKTPSGKAVTVFELEGDVPSQFQFYVTDTTKHFLRGALYFRTSTKNDSLAPIIDYIKVDIMHMLNSLEWKHDAK